VNADAAKRGRVTVTVAWSPGPRQVQEAELELPSGSTVRQALEAAGVSAPASGLLGIWGRKVDADEPVRDGDRIELYRMLRVDPKQARRERFGRQGARSAGLSAQRRPGAKPGY
jgi:sulfur carrier protein